MSNNQNNLLIYGRGTNCFKNCSNEPVFTISIESDIEIDDLLPVRNIENIKDALKEIKLNN